MSCPSVGGRRGGLVLELPPEIAGLLQQVQMDHTPVDVIVVDERHRLPIGRPYVTVAIDVATRCVVGLVVTLEAPSATSVGLCLARTATGKQAWLEQLGVEAVWPMAGKPHELYVDNAAEFKSEALRRGCEQHGIALSYRPPGLPHFGGIVERVIGTMMRLVHDELPGTTFSNIAQRGDYDSDGRAVLTMTELNAWLALAVACYHGQTNDGLGRTPAAVWAELAERDGTPGTVSNETAILVDFLPVIRKVELGSCARPYGSPCQHEHACVRCPMLHVDPLMLPRLGELEADLVDRRVRAAAEGWLGELEGWI